MSTKNRLITIFTLIAVTLGAGCAQTSMTDADMNTQPISPDTTTDASAVPEADQHTPAGQHEAYYSEDHMLGWTVKWTQPSEAGALFDGTESVQELLIESPSGNVSLRLEELIVSDVEMLRRQIATRYPTLALPEREAYIVPFAGMVSDSGLVLVGTERILTVNPTDTFDWPLELDEETISFIQNVQVP